MRVLILGGTSEASQLAARIAGEATVVPTLSLAGRTLAPARPLIPFRIGGFGGTDGLAAYLTDHRIEAVVDATHPFAAQISANAAQACARIDIPRVILTRPPWSPQAGDRWTIVPHLDAAAVALGGQRRRVFLTTGRLGLAAFKTAPQHRYLIRSIDPPAPADRPPDHAIVLERGPFTREAEIALMRHHAVDVVVSKNSGGSGAKVAAARELGLPVVMVARPPLPNSPVLLDVEAAVAWIADQARRP